MAFTTIFKMENVVSFVNAKMTDIPQDILVSNFDLGAIHDTCMQHVHSTMCALCNYMSFPYFKISAASTFSVIHFDDRMLASCSDSDDVLVMNATLAYLSNSAQPKVDFPYLLFHSAAYRYVQALHALFDTIRSFTKAMFVEDGVTGSMASVVSPHTPSLQRCFKYF